MVGPHHNAVHVGECLGCSMRPRSTDAVVGHRCAPQSQHAGCKVHSKTSACVPHAIAVAGTCLPRSACDLTRDLALDHCTGSLGAGFVTCDPLLRGTCAIEDGAFMIRGKTPVTLEQAKFPGGSDFVACNLTGSTGSHPFAYRLDNVKGARTAASLTTATCLTVRLPCAHRLTRDV